MKRPTGLTVLGVLGILFGISGALANGALLIGIVSQPGLNVSPAAIVSVGANILSSALILAAGIGIFVRQPWARPAYLAACGITVANRLLAFPMHFRSQPQDSVQATAQVAAMLGDIGNMIFCGFAIWYMLQATTVQFLDGRPGRSSAKP